MNGSSKLYSVVTLALVTLLLFSVVYASSQPVPAASSDPPGQGIAYVNVTDTIVQSSQNSAHIYVTENLKYNGSGNINFSLINANDITLLENGKAYPFARIFSATCNIFVEESINCTTILIHNVNSSSEFTLSYGYYVNYIPNSKNIFNYTFTFMPFSPTQLKVDTILPPSAFLPNDTYYAPPGAVFASNGEEISVVWSLFQVTSTPIPLPFSVTYKLTSFSSNAAQGVPNTLYYITLAIIAGAAVIIFLVYFYMRRRLYKHPDKKHSMKGRNPFLEVLNENEKKVLRALRRDSFVTQKELIAITGFSKAKMSKILSKLLRYRLVKIKPDGRLNKVKRV